MIISAFLEMISIGATVPFLAVLTNPDDVYNSVHIQPLIIFLDISSSKQLMLPLTIIFIALAFIAGVIRLLLLYFMARISFLTGADLSIDIYSRTLYQSYSEHVMQNSSLVITGIITKTNTVVNGVLGPVLRVISGIILVTGIIFTLFSIDISASILAILGFGCLYILISVSTRRRVKKNSLHIANEEIIRVKVLQEGLGGIRDVIIDGTQDYYCGMYKKADLKVRQSAFENSFIGAAPHSIMTTIGMSLIALLAYVLTQRDGEMAGAIPILGALALGAQRLLPALQQIYQGFTTIRGANKSLEDVLDLLSQPNPKYAEHSDFSPIKFEQLIELKDVDFRYTEGGPMILNNINLLINKGESIGFVGETGSGKSTLIDVIMGLLDINKNNLYVDGVGINENNCREWRLHIAHVPQSIYLSDSTITENIAFGIPKNEIDFNRVKLVSKQAQISRVIEGWEDEYQTFVGERGIRLSGGQRQRIGIARALYKNADILVLDEATSALDSETERLIMKEIESLSDKLTIIMIAHRVSTLKRCKKIVEINNGEIVNIETRV